MGRIIFSIVSLVILAIIIVMNAGSTTNFNVLGWQFESVPVIAVAIVSFVVGSMYSFIFYISSYFARVRREKLAMQKQRLKTQEKSMKSKDETLKAREKQMTALASAAAETPPRRLPPGTGSEPFAARHVGSGSADAGPSTRSRSGGWLRNLFGRKTNSGS